MLSALPFAALYALASFLAWLAYGVFPYRQEVVRENLTKAFPDLDEAGLRGTMKGYYLGFAQVLVELIKAATLPADEVLQRVKITGLEAPRGLLDNGKAG